MTRDSLTINPAELMVLLIDDQAMVGEAIRRQLAGSEDINFHFCANPEEALEIALRIRPTVILQDLVMPKVDGLALVQRFRDHPRTRDIPIIVLSTKEDPAVKGEAFARGANDYLVKLPDKIELVARVRYHSKAYLTQLQRDEAYRALRQSQQELIDSNTALISLNQKLEELTRAKSDFLANMSHEIRTPMNGVLGMTAFLADTTLTGEQQEFVDIIRSSSESLLNIINDILDFSKIESGKLEIESHPFELRRAVEDALELLSPMASEKKLNLIFIPDQNAPESVVGDVTRLRQILINLVTNAVKFTAAGEIIVRTQQNDIDATSLRLTFSVQDSGIGIPADKLDRLFKSFSQVDSSTTRQFGGTGLGLAISKRLAELMGGSIWVESVHGAGSTFFFTVIVTKSTQPPAANPISLPGKKAFAYLAHGSTRELLTAWLNAAGMSLEVAPSAQEFLGAFRGRTDDLLIVDGVDESTAGQISDAYKLAFSPASPPMILLSPTRAKNDAWQELPPGRAFITHKPLRQNSFNETLRKAFPQTALSAAPKVAGATINRNLGQQFPLTILLADDNRVNQMVGSGQLRKLGYSARIVNNGVEVITTLEREYFDIVFLDMQMPEMDGFEAARQIHKRFAGKKRPTLIAMTGAAREEDKADCFSAGIDDFISKPVRVSDLETALRRWADERKK